MKDLQSVFMIYTYIDSDSDSNSRTVTILGKL